MRSLGCGAARPELVYDFVLERQPECIPRRGGAPEEEHNLGICVVAAKDWIRTVEAQIINTRHLALPVIVDQDGKE